MRITPKYTTNQQGEPICELTISVSLRQLEREPEKCMEWAQKWIAKYWVNWRASHAIIVQNAVEDPNEGL